LQDAHQFVNASCVWFNLDLWHVEPKIGTLVRYFCPGERLH